MQNYADIAQETMAIFFKGDLACKYEDTYFWALNEIQQIVDVLYKR